MHYGFHVLLGNVYTLSAGGPPVPLTPDYGAPNVSYADGVFDPHFSRYITVMEGTLLITWNSILF